MITDTQIKSQILKKINKIPKNRLKELMDFINKLERKTDKKSRILTFAGCWSNISDSIIEDLTDNLITNRSRNNRRFDE